MPNISKSSVQSQQVDYNLHTLGWKAFQDLCSTIVAEVWGQTAQIFSETRDGGRDGAFRGIWKPKEGEADFQEFVVQCKFSNIQGKSIALSDLSEELEKARSLSERGLCSSYLVLTNAKSGGQTESSIREAFEAIPGINRCQVFGKEWVTRKINETPRLRMLVPQVYGLGDLSQILDERAYDQSAEILSSLGGDIKKFVVTDAHQKSARALLEHGFVLLLGEPACGKSTIAAALAMAALDEWGCSTLKIVHPADFRKHSNPTNFKQFFWVDDAFGATQHEDSLTSGWNLTFPHVNAAIKRGAKVIFTSRSYIYRSAREHLKESALPVAKESQVVIDVEDLTVEERHQILYNHLKHGNQPKEFKTDIKPFLPAIAENSRFSPEIARRLADPLFTSKLKLNTSEITRFVEEPLDFLKEVITTIGADHKAALALIFIRGGSLESPVAITDSEQSAIDLLSSDLPQIRSSFRTLEQSLVIKEFSDGKIFWRFKHPTIRDAFSVMVGEDQELLDIYLGGVRPEKMFSEVSCGIDNIKGITLVVPDNRFEKVLRLIASYRQSRHFNDRTLDYFLGSRCSRSFLEAFVARFPDYPEKLTHFYWLEVFDPKTRLLEQLGKWSLLSESIRLQIAKKIRSLVIQNSMRGFPNSFTDSILTDIEKELIIEAIRVELLPNLDDLIQEAADNFEGDQDPDDHFYDLEKSIESYTELLDLDDCCDDDHEDYDSVCFIVNALQQIEDLKKTLEMNSPENDSAEWGEKPPPNVEISDRSIFDDVDL